MKKTIWVKQNVNTKTVMVDKRIKCEDEKGIKDFVTCTYENTILTKYDLWTDVR